MPARKKARPRNGKAAGDSKPARKQPAPGKSAKQRPKRKRKVKQQAAGPPRYRIRLEAEVNGRYRCSTIYALAPDGNTVLATDRANLMKAAERSKSARRIAAELGEDAAEVEARLNEAHTATINDYQRMKELAAAGSPEAVPATPAGESGEDGEDVSGQPTRPEIVISTEEHEVNDQAARALGRDESVYQRGELLVRLVWDASPDRGGIHRPHAPRIDPLPPALLRERLAACARWQEVRMIQGAATLVSGRPPGWCIAAVHARACWPGVRHLEAVVDYPVLRPDGTVLSAPGYDLDTGLLLEVGGGLPDVPESPTHAEAVAACDELLGVVSDFPFDTPAHKAAWLAALLTPLARFAFAGPAPLFLVDANTRGAGKGLLLDCIARILTGDRFTVAAYTADEDELRKRITSLTISGDRLVLFDNLEGRFGNATLDAALTATSWEDRLLGVNRMVRAPLLATWFATGNNVTVLADTARRICHVRLESPEEHPEERSGFQHPDLLGHVGRNRRQLLGAALVILRGYCAAGRPDQHLSAWGSFDGWSGLVRAAVVWTGLEDPGQTRRQLQEQADTTAGAMGLLLECWEHMDPCRGGLTTAEVVDRLFKHPESSPPGWHADMRDAIERLVGRGDSHALGIRLRNNRRRIFGGRFIDRAGQEHSAARWAVHPAQAFGQRSQHPPHPPRRRPPAGVWGRMGEDGEDVAAQAENSLHTAEFSSETDAPDAPFPCDSWGNVEDDGRGDAWEGGDD